MDHPQTIIADLHGEIDALQRQLADARAAIDALEQRSALLADVIEHAPMNISVIDRDKRLLLINTMTETALGIDRANLIGKTQQELFGDALVATWDVSDQQVLTSARPYNAEDTMPLDDGVHTFLSVKYPLIDSAGHVYAIGNLITDITAQKRHEYEQIDLRQQIIDAQQATLREVSTPLVPIAAGIVAMPLVGAIDTQRAQQMIATLLEGIGERQASTAILDITGVRVVDTSVAQALVQAAQAAGLLGAQVVLTGIGPEVAQSLVQLGADLRAIVVRSDLQAGIAYAMRRVV